MAMIYEPARKQNPHMCCKLVGGFVCRRAKGHKGPHARWTDEAQSEAKAATERTESESRNA